MSQENFISKIACVLGTHSIYHGPASGEHVPKYIYIKKEILPKRLLKKVKCKIMYVNMLVMKVDKKVRCQVDEQDLYKRSLAKKLFIKLSRRL